MPTPDQQQERPYFDAGRMPSPYREYVAWFDVIGTRSHVAQSHLRGANFFAKIHLAALRATSEAVCLYPVMDGFYATCRRQSAMLAFVRDFYRLITITFCSESENRHRFVVRGALSFGPVTHGRDLPEDCARFSSDTYRDGLLFGIAMIQAYEAERNSPPLGLYVHESARAFAPDGDRPFSGLWWRWWRNDDEPLLAELREAIPDYYAWALDHAHEHDYDPERAKAHRALACEYFAISPV